MYLLHDRLLRNLIDGFRLQKLLEVLPPSEAQCPHCASTGIVHLWSVEDLLAPYTVCGVEETAGVLQAGKTVDFSSGFLPLPCSETVFRPYS